MKLKYILFAAALSLVLQSCVVLSPKKYKGLIAERDSLLTRSGGLQDTAAALRADTMRMHRELSDLRNNHSALNDKYNALNNNFNANIEG